MVVHLTAAQLGLFLLTVCIVAIVPGPDVFYVVSQALTGGRARGLSAILGILSGFAVHVCIAILVLSAFVARSQTVFTLVREAGAVYLIYLGVTRLFFSPKNAAPESPVRASRSAFFFGFITNVSNPKAALFTYSLLPQFVNPANGPVAPQLAELGVVAASIAFIILCGYVLAAGAVSGRIERNKSAAFIERFGIGSLFLVLGIRFLAAW